MKVVYRKTEKSRLNSSVPFWNTGIGQWHGVLPFGLFAGCSTGKIADSTSIELPATKDNKRRTRLDMQYLCALIQEIERDPNVREQLVYYPNDSLYEIGGKYRYKKPQRRI